MLGLILRLFLLLALASALGLGLRALVAMPGLVWFQWGDHIYEMRPLVFVGLTLLGALALMLAMAMLRLVWGGPTMLRRLWAGRQQRNGLGALSAGLTALAMQDGRAAVGHLRRAERLLGDPTLTRVPMTQALRMIGDDRTAALYEQALTTDPSTAWLGWRGLAEAAMRAGDTAAASRHAQAALAARPQDDWAARLLLRLAVQAGDWAGAKAILAKTKRERHQRPHQEAALSLAEAEALIAEGRSDAALPLALEAVRLAPGFVPAVYMAASLLGPEQERKASRLVLDAWKIQPHPDLLRALAHVLPQDSPAQRLERLLAVNDRGDFARLARAQQALDAGDVAAARQYLTGLAASPALAAIEAQLAQSEGQEVSALLATALCGQSGWVCADCGRAHAAWQVLCAGCHGFDRLEWRGPMPSLKLANASPKRHTASPTLVAPPPPQPPSPPLQRLVEPDQAVRTADAGWEEG